MLFHPKMYPRSSWHTEQMAVTDAAASANSQLHVKESRVMFWNTYMFLVAVVVVLHGKDIDFCFLLFWLMKRWTI